MENKQYLINSDDYIQLVEGQVCMYCMLSQIFEYAKQLPKCTMQIKQKCEAFEEICSEIIESMGLPEEYLTDLDIDSIREVMLDNLIEPEEAGYVPDNVSDMAKAAEHCIEAFRILTKSDERPNH